MTELKRYDLDEIRKAINILFADVKFGSGECVEVRVPDKKKHITISGWFDDPEMLAKAVAKLARDGFGDPGSYRHVHENAYWTCNPASDALLARQPKNKMAIAADTTTDNNITRRIWFPIDIDPLRPSGVSATREEKKLSAEVATVLINKLEELGFPGGCLVGGTSGNGYHILVRIDLPNDFASRDLLKRCLAAMQEMVGTGKVEVDPKVFNSARIVKCYGTVACKGENTPDRPWRWSKLTVVPETVVVCPTEVLEKLAALAPDKNPKRDLGEKRQGPWTVENTQEYLDWTTWDNQQKARGQPNEVAKWIGPCIKDENHKDSAVILHTDGWWSYGCFHASCEVNDKNFRDYWEGWLDEKYKYPGHRAPVVANSTFEFEDAVQGETPTRANPELNTSPVALPASNVLKVPLQAWPLTDSGNMERFVARYGHIFRYCPQRDWYSWDTKHWVTDDIGLVYRGALATVRKIVDEIPLHIAGVQEADLVKAIISGVEKWAKTSESRKNLSAMEFLSRSAKGIAVNFSEFDRDPWLFNCDNGTLDLQSGDFQPQAQSDVITNISPVVYDPKATCPLWLDFLSDVMAGQQEMIGFLQRTAGYSLTGSTVEHCLFLLWGSGRNGKSTFLEVLRHIIGTYGKSASMATFLEQQYEGIPNDLAALAGARFVTAVETQDSKRLDESKIKQITGGDTVTARFLHKEFFQYRPQFKIWLATNHKPVIRGTDEGIWRRIKLVPFNVYIPDGKKDEKLTEKLISEASGILNWLLEGLVDYRRDGLQDPEEVTKATDEYRAEEDWVARFLQSETVEDKNGAIPARSFYNRYKNWADDARERTLSERKFAEAMKNHEHGSVKRNTGSWYEGLKLLDHLGHVGADVMDTDVF
jgi:P4 family phage/plasmid primase-like protien